MNNKIIIEDNYFDESEDLSTECNLAEKKNIAKEVGVYAEQSSVYGEKKHSPFSICVSKNQIYLRTIDSSTQTDFIEDKVSESIITDISENSSDSIFSDGFLNDDNNKILLGKTFSESLDELVFMEREIQTDNINMKDEITQTESNDLIKGKNKDEIIEKLKNDYEKLEKNFRDVVQLLSIVTKTYIDPNTKEFESIRTQILLLMNRELRMRFAFPFVNILGKFGKF